MTAFVIRRIAWAGAVLLAVGLLTFFVAYVMPGDPARAIAGQHASPRDVQRIRESLGLDQPLLEQLGRYLGRLLRLDFGYSFRQGQPVLGLIVQRAPATVELAVAAVLIEVLIGVPLGVLAALRAGGWMDRGIRLGSVALVAVPSFWVGYVLLNVLAFQPARAGLPIFPIGGYVALDPRYVILPAVTLALSGLPFYARLTRNVVLEEMRRDYVRTARAKGAAERRVVGRHVLRNVLPTIVSQLGIELGLLLGGVVLIEQIFSWPGIGKLAVDAIVKQDVPMILGTVLVGTVCVVVANLVVDITYVYLDPRARPR